MLNQIDTFFANADLLAGKIATVVYAKEQKIRKSHANLNATILKRSTFQIRVGVEYANKKAIKEGHANGTIERRGLPSSLEKISRSRLWNNKRNVDVLGASSLENGNARKTEWFLNGDAVEFETVKPYLYAQRKDGMPDWFTLDYPAIESLSGVC